MTPAILIALLASTQTELGLAVHRLDVRADRIAGCRTQRVSGSVKYGETFVRSIRPTMDLVLLPEGDLGWTLKIGSSGGGDRKTYGDHIYPVSPPYRFFNPRYIGAIYGFSATQALEMRERPFNFVMQRDLSAAQEAIQHVLWPKSENDELRALQTLSRMPLGHGVLTLLDGRKAVRRINGEPFEILEQVAFRVDLCWPDE